MQNRLRHWALTLFVLIALLPGAPVQLAAAPAGQGVEPVSTIQKIRQRNNLLLAGVPYDFKPFGFIDEAGEVVGFDVDLMRALANLWGVEVQFVPVTAADGVQKLAAGAIDLTTSLVHRWEHETRIDFSQTYFADSQGLLWASAAGFESLADLNGKTLAFVRGAGADKQFGQLAASRAITSTLLPFQEYPAALAALKAGQVDALLANNSFVRQARLDSAGLVGVALDLPAEPYAFGLPSKDATFRHLVNAGLQVLKEEGVYDRLYAKWFADAEPYPLEVLPGQLPYTLLTAPTTFTPTASSRIETIQQRGKLVVGVPYDAPPFGFADVQGQLDGFDVALAREFAARWLGNPLQVDLAPVTPATALPMLANGAIDLVIAALPLSLEGSDAIDFSQSYLLDEQVLLVQAESGIDGLNDLNDKSVAAINGTTAVENLRIRAVEAGITFNMLPFQEVRSAVQAVQAGQVDALAHERTALLALVNANPALTLVDPAFATTRYAIGLPPWDDALRDQVNFTLQAMKVDGVYDALHRQWFPDGAPYPIEVWPGQFANALSGRAWVTAPTPLTTTPPLAATPTPLPATATLATKPLILLPTPTPTPPLFATVAPSPTVGAVTLYIVQANDTLSSIAGVVYGDQFLWPLIYEANINLIGANPNVLIAGTTLVIPER